VGNEENEYPVPDHNGMMTNMFYELSDVCKELLKEELKKELTEILMEKFQEKVKENIQNQLKEKQENTNKFEKTQKQQ
jgi:predicted CopG family antitoxin